MRIRGNNLGTLLAILAGLTSFAFTIWPVEPPQSRGEPGTVWGLAIYVIGPAFILAAFLAHTRVWLARWILVSGAVMLMVSGAAFGLSWNAFGLGSKSALFDALPAIMALIAAGLIGPIEQSAEERRAQQQGQLPDLPLSPEEQEHPYDRAA